MDKLERCRLSRLARWGVRTVEERFWAKVDKSGDCWLWTGARTPNGYGRFALSKPGHPVYVHRLSWRMANDNAEIPAKMDICHTCDVRHCVRPSHLWLGTRGDNLRDMAAKGRGHRQGMGIKPEPRGPRTACIHGHAWPQNKNAAGVCLPCKRRINREYARRKSGWYARH